jgi:DNA polymerase-3 subunit delta'
MRASEIHGNTSLLSLLRRNPLPPASLFTGPEGTGKRAAALCLAARWSCRQPVDEDSCGSCVSCVKAEAGNHPDILTFLPEKNVIKIESMRDLSREAHYRPFEGSARFFVIDQAEKMTEEAANSLLKTLEEPPETSHLILVTAFPNRLLPTIRSRCQTFPFRALTRAEIADYLVSVGRSEGAELRAAFADGSIGRALSIDLETLIRDRDAALELLEAWQRTRSFEAIFKRLEAAPFRADIKDRERVKNYLELLQSITEDIYFILVLTPDRVVNLDRRDRLERLASQLSLDWARNLLYHIGQSYWDVDHYVSPLMCLETLWLRAEQG